MKIRMKALRGAMTFVFEFEIDVDFKMLDGDELNLRRND
jgi:hypothetical protein